MKYIFQVIAYGQLDDLDFDETHHLATTPNPIFLTEEGAKTYVTKDVNENREGRCKDEGEEFLPLLWLSWVTVYWDHETEPNRIRYVDDDTGITYDIVTGTLGE